MRFMEVVIEDIKGSRQLQSWHNLMLYPSTLSDS